MAKYDFKCEECGKVLVDVVLSITHVPEDRPKCHGKPMGVYITQAPMMHWKDYELPGGGYRSISTKDRPVITSKKQEREYLKRNGLVHADDLGPPPSHEQEREVIKKADEAIAQIDGRAAGLNEAARKRLTERMAND